MPISELPILSMLRTKMHWHQERQRVLAENVANADTPKFRPRDLEPPKFDPPQSQQATAVTLARTDPSHLGGLGGGLQFGTQRPTRYDVKPAGNAVSLEDEMMKVSANQMDYQAATSLYSRSMGLFRTALGRS
jgi:flagellar basal-body rod protein FlgB